jgi:hypothetical protein
MTEREIKIKKLTSILFSTRPLKIPFGLRLFIIGKGEYLRIYKESIEIGGI